MLGPAPPARKNVQAGTNDRDLPSRRANEKTSADWFGTSLTSFRHLLWFRFEQANACSLIKKLERAVRLELTIPDLQSGALAAWRHALNGTEGEIRTLESSLEDSHVSSYITSASGASQGNSRLGCGVR